MRLELHAFTDLVKRYCTIFKTVWAARKQLETPSRQTKAGNGGICRNKNRQA